MPKDKHCYKCETVKPIGEFNKNKSKPDGVGSECCECVRKYKRENRSKLLISERRYRKDHPEMKRKADKKYYAKNKESIRARQREWEKENADRLREHNRLRGIKYRKENPSVRVAQSIRARINGVLNGRIKSGSTFDLLGCDRNGLANHLEVQFKNEMSWDNYGEWHIDHIKPCASFDLTNPKEQSECFHYSNLQPLWALENLRKHCKTMD